MHSAIYSGSEPWESFIFYFSSFSNNNNERTNQPTNQRDTITASWMARWLASWQRCLNRANMAVLARPTCEGVVRIHLHFRAHCRLAGSLAGRPADCSMYGPGSSDVRPCVHAAIPWIIKGPDPYNVIPDKQFRQFAFTRRHSLCGRD